jgi:hypothetical protein
MKTEDTSILKVHYSRNRVYALKEKMAKEKALAFPKFLVGFGD